MNRFSPTLSYVRTRLAEHFELFMTTVGVLLAIMIILSELSGGEQGTALIFLIWLQGFILWAVHRHCTLRTHAVVDRVRMMVQDRVNNRLTVWLSLTDVQSRMAAEAGRDGGERCRPPQRGPWRWSLRNSLSSRCAPGNGATVDSSRRRVLLGTEPLTDLRPGR